MKTANLFQQVNQTNHDPNNYETKTHCYKRLSKGKVPNIICHKPEKYTPQNHQFVQKFVRRGIITYIFDIIIYVGILRMYKIVRMFLEHFSTKVTKNYHLLLNSYSKQISIKIQWLQEKLFPRSIEYPMPSLSCSHPMVLSPLIPLTPAVTSKIKPFLVLSWFAVSLVSFFVQRHYHLHFP